MVWVTILVGALIGSLALVVFFLTRLPPTYFHLSHDRRFMDDSHWAIRSCAVAAKNAIGIFLVLLGIVMSVPGIPGQGLLTLAHWYDAYRFSGQESIGIQDHPPGQSPARRQSAAADLLEASIRAGVTASTRAR
jgi:hypothetical protein